MPLQRAEGTSQAKGEVIEILGDYMSYFGKERTPYSLSADGLKIEFYAGEQ